MPKKLATRGAQYLLASEFIFNSNEWVVDTADGIKKTFGSSVANSTDPAEPGLTALGAQTLTFDAINMPPGAVLQGGELIVETVSNAGTTHTVSIGIAGATTAYAATASLIATTRVDFTATTNVKLSSIGGQNIRLTVVSTGTAPTAGRFRVRVYYTIDNKINEAVHA